MTYRYLEKRDGPNRAQRRKSRHDSISNREKRRCGHRMNRPERMELISAGNFKLSQFFKIN